MLASPLCLLLPNGRLPWLLATAVSWVVLALAVVTVTEVATRGPVSYWMGGWEPPWGIEYRVDGLNSLVVLIVAAIGAVVLPRPQCAGRGGGE